MRPLGLLVLLAACDRDGNGNNNNNNGDYPAVLNDAEETEECGSLQISGCPFGAATTYFAGEYDFDGADVTGFEYWYWIPNDVLADQSDDWEPDTPCLLIFEFFGAKDDEADCNACLYQLTGDATFLADESDCATELETSSLTDPSVWTGIVYNVREGDGGNVDVFYESGTQLGSGPGNDSHLEWVSEADCETVGATEEGCTPQ